MAKQETQILEETKLWSFITLCQSQTRMQGGKTQKKSTMQQIRKLWNPTCEIFATCEIEKGKESLQDRELMSCMRFSQLAKWIISTCEIFAICI